MHRTPTTTLAALVATAVFAVGPAVAAGPPTLPLGNSVVSVNWTSLAKRQTTTIRPADMASLNPQPLPPKDLKRPVWLAFGNEVMLNPQPLPPKQWGY